MSKEPSYVRCIKPNDSKQSGMISSPFSVNVVQNTIEGILSNVVVKCLNRLFASFGDS